MRIEIDQSNKIEQTNKDTIIGLSNGKVFTVLIKRQVKRKLQEEFRRQGKIQLFVYRTFIASVVLMLKYAKLDNLQNVIIDQEYLGNEKILRSMFLEMWSRYFDDMPNIHFENIGKKSRAHKISYLTGKGKIEANMKIDFAEIKRLVLK